MRMASITAFHAHIYFTQATRDSASRLRQKLVDNLGGLRCRIYPLVDRPVGPHPLPMFEVDIMPGDLEPVVVELMLNHGNHSVLIHPVTGDDLKDHRDHPLWLDTPLPLDYSEL